jgi:16S rRNA C967 or C1407 C5-methylase (RsmB/RsmF family)
LKKDFINYIKREFGFDDKQVEKFENSLNTPLKKSIRVNTNKISVSDFKLRAKKNNWTLTATNL